MLQIKIYPHPVLNHECKSLKLIDKELVSLIDEARELMINNNGIGLAANQVGLPYRFFLTNFEELPIVINPIMHIYGDSEDDIESCLSIPNFSVKVRRKKQVKLSGFDLKGNDIKLKLCNGQARVVQHEMEHLFGRTLINHLDARSNVTPLEKMILEFQEPKGWKEEIFRLETLRC